jgi:hypothetical protein
MTALTVDVPETVDIGRLEVEVVTALADRLRDEHGDELAQPPTLGDDAASDHVYALSPTGRIVVRHHGSAMTIELRDVDVDARDLYTGVSSELEQRYDGLRIQLG